VNALEVMILELILTLFPYKFDSIEAGFKYLGYFFKPNNYMKKWLVWAGGESWE